MATHRKSTDSVEDACTKLLILRNPIVAHALLRAVFALLRTPVATEPKRSQECERGTQSACATARLHHLWWASRPMGTPSRSRFGSAVEACHNDSRLFASGVGLLHFCPDGPPLPGHQ